MPFIKIIFTFGKSFYHKTTSAVPKLQASLSFLESVPKTLSLLDIDVTILPKAGRPSYIQLYKSLQMIVSILN